MFTIAITGGIGSGKSQVGRLLREAGAYVIDADVIARKTLEVGQPGYRLLVQEFGSRFLRGDSETQVESPNTSDSNEVYSHQKKQSLGLPVDRGVLAQEMFSNAAIKESVENIIHPIVHSAYLQALEDAQAKDFKSLYYEHPLLFEKNQHDSFNFIVVVNAPLELRKRRLIDSRHILIDDVEQRIAAQIPLQEKCKQAHWVVDNSKDLGSLQQEVQKLISKVNTLVNAHRST